MPKEILIQIINEKLIINFIAILIIYFASSWIFFKLSFQFLGIKVKSQRIFWGILPNIIYMVLGKQIFPDLVYILVYITILTVLIRVMIGKMVAVSWLRVVWSAFLVEFIVGIGVTLLQPIIVLIPAIGQIITTRTPAGVVYGAICEGIFPLILWFVLRTVNISIIPPVKTVKHKVDLLDLGNLYIFIVPFLWLYGLSARTFKSLETNPKIDLMDLFYQLFLTVSLFIVYYWVYATTKRRHDKEKRELEDKNERLESEKNILMAELKKQRILNGFDNDQKLGSMLNDYTMKVIEVALEMSQSSKKKHKEPVIIPDEINLRKLVLDSKNGNI
jgi:hypothetical protein